MDEIVAAFFDESRLSEVKRAIFIGRSRTPIGDDVSILALAAMIETAAIEMENVW